jgi:autotransporter-associated beta strand protein
MFNFETEPMKSMLKSIPRPFARLLFLVGGVVMLSDRLPATTYTWVPTANNGRWKDETAYWSLSNLVSSTTSDVILTNGALGNNGANTATGAASYLIRSLTFDNGGFDHRLHLSAAYGGVNTVARNLTFSADLGNATLKVNSTATGNYEVTANGYATSSIIMTSSLDVIHDGSGTLTLGDSTVKITGGVGQTLTKSGTGTLIFGGANTYLGPTQVQQGTLRVNSDSSAATGAATVASGATIAGFGTLGGSLSLAAETGSGAANGGRLAPSGSGVNSGVLTVNGATNFNTGSIFSWDLATLTETGRGSSFDGVNVGGNLNIASGSIFQIVLGTSGSQTNSFWDTGRTWSGVFNVTGTKSGAFDTFKVVDSSFNPVTISSPGSFSFDSSTGSLSWAAVPEPTSALVGLLIGAGGLRRRRKCSAAR